MGGGCWGNVEVTSMPKPHLRMWGSLNVSIMGVTPHQPQNEKSKKLPPRANFDFVFVKCCAQVVDLVETRRSPSEILKSDVIKAIS